jgi:putative flippase GtrA
MDNIVKQFTSREHTPFVQFIKYGICGCIATGVNISLFYLCAYLLLPALTANDPFVRALHLNVVPVTDAIRTRNSIVDNGVAFIFSNLVAYLLNIFWVFKSGRHHWLIEIGLFYLVSGTSAAIGTLLMGWLIYSRGTVTSLAFGANVIVSLLINFVLRKYVIFKE